MYIKTDKVKLSENSLRISLNRVVASDDCVESEMLLEYSYKACCNEELNVSADCDADEKNLCSSLYTDLTKEAVNESENSLLNSLKDKTLSAF